MSKYCCFCILLTGCFKQLCLLKAQTFGRLPNIDYGFWDTCTGAHHLNREWPAMVFLIWVACCAEVLGKT